MLDPKLVRNDLTDVVARLKTRGFEFAVAKFNALEEQRKQLQVTLQQFQNERNTRSREIGVAKTKQQVSEVALAELKTLSVELDRVQAQFTLIQTELEDFLAYLPNLPHASVPIGRSEADNQVIRTVGEIPQFDFTPQDHAALCGRNNLMDFETAAKLAGARFVVLRGPLARLQRALIQFMLDVHTQEYGYQEIAVPYIVNAECLFGTGQLPKLKDDVFAIAGRDQYLIPTAEVPVTNTVRDSILLENELPLKYVCYSSCFRSEAGSYGRDMRGMLRQHQFEKVELVQIVRPTDSYAVLEELTGHAESILQRLQLPYRCVTLCSADLGFSAAKTYDLEVWLPSQQCYREISSCSNTENFQARRIKARFRDAAGKLELVHMLNGSALAIGRTLIAILENFQDKLGRIHIPPVLHSYMGGLKIIE